MFSLLIFISITFSSASSIALQCQFLDSSWGYKCADNVTTITSRSDRTISNVSGDHFDDRNDENVLTFSAYKTNLFYFPRELTNFFENIKYISIKSCGLKELTCGDLEQFGDKLTYLWLCNNEIQIIEKNLFKNNPNLAILNLIGNKIKFVEHGAISALAYPHSLYLKNNPCYSGSITYDEEGLEAFMEEVEEKCTFGGVRAQFYEAFDKVDEMKGKIEELEREIERLKSQLEQYERNDENSGENSGDQE